MSSLKLGIIFTYLKNSIFVLFLSFSLSACSTIDGIFGGEDENEPAIAASEMPQEDMEPIAEATETPEQEMMRQKDEALMAQAMRLAEAERALIALQEQNNALEADLTEARQEALEKQAMLDEQNERQINQAAPPANVPRMTAPDGGYGLHVASFELQESIAPGLAAIERQIPVLTEGRPIKIAMADVRGRTFHRLIIGQFNSQSEAVAECNQAKLLIDFCDVIAFEGEDF